MRLLFVCLGNICRSPTAEAVLRHLAAAEAPELHLLVDSAGTGNYHVGQPPDRRSIAAAAGRGIDLSDLRARQLVREDFERFDFLLAMDRQNLLDMHALALPVQRRKAQLFLEAAGHTPELEIPDPYEGGPEDFELVLDLATQGARGLIARCRRAAASGKKTV
ncbi:MAG TPA: low molecular weight protein-tyrosine-phosphatase [Steroidobacteraceae bacterium]